MYNKVIIYILFCSITFSACTKVTELELLDSSQGESITDENAAGIIADDLLVNEGEELSFTLKGIKDPIVFWSGEPGHEYVNKNRSLTQLESIHMSFNAYPQWGGQPNTLRIRVSTDFDGDYTREGVQRATWSNISSRAALPGQWVSAVTPTGNINLIDFFDNVDNEVYIALQYISYAQDDAANQGSGAKKTWTITNFTMPYKFPEAAAKNYTLSDLAWTPVNISPNSAPSQQWNVSSSTQLQIIGGGAGPATEDWVVSRKIQEGEGVVSDIGQPLTLDQTGDIQTYTHTFAEKGKYRVTFEVLEESATEATIYEFVITVQ